MSLNRLTKDQLVEKLKREEKLTAELEIKLGDTRRELSKMEQNANEAFQLANRANITVETFRYLLEETDRSEGHLRVALENLSALHEGGVGASSVRGKVIERMRKLTGPVVICPRCGQVQKSAEHDVLLCQVCVSERVLSQRQD